MPRPAPIKVEPTGEFRSWLDRLRESVVVDEGLFPVKARSVAVRRPGRVVGRCNVVKLVEAEIAAGRHSREVWVVCERCGLWTPGFWRRELDGTMICRACARE